MQLTSFLFSQSQQLIKSPSRPSDPGFFKVKKVIRSRTVSGVKEVLVNFHNYPAKKQVWIKAENLKKHRVPRQLV